MSEQLTRAEEALQAKRLGEAAGICSDLLADDPNNASALAILGVAAIGRGDLEGGVKTLEKALELGENATWCAFLCNSYRALNRIDDAVRVGLRALELDGKKAPVLVTLALAYADRGQYDEAMACLIRSAGENHDYADGHLALAEELLARGEFAAGWREYEWRNKCEAAKGKMPDLTSMPWNGQKLPGRLLVVCDQGYGDCIQFMRYLPRISKLCDEMVMGVSEELEPLFRQFAEYGRIITRWPDVPGHAAHMMLSSAPLLLGADFPHSMSGRCFDYRGPYLKADAEKISEWDAKLPAGLRVGLAWAGRPTHPNDRRRSIRLEQLLPLAEVADARFVALQKPVPACDQSLLMRFPGMYDLGERIETFGDTAAIISLCDVVITVDSSVAHLAGAMQKPVWVMLPKNSDWRWMRGRDDSPWYPSARLFRQETCGDWAGVIRRVADSLSFRVASGGGMGLVPQIMGAATNAA